MSLVLAVTVGALYAIGAWLLMQRSLTRIVIGLAMLGHGANLLLMTAGGRAGDVPMAGGDPATTADPLPQALALTAIVITFGVSGFLLAMAYRSWRQRDDDTVEDDLEDRRLAMAVQRLDHDRERREAREAEARDAEAHEAEAREAEGHPMDGSGESDGSGGAGPPGEPGGGR